MKQRLVEQLVLLVSIVKWFVLASSVGLIVGLSTTAFLKALTASSGFVETIPYHFLLVPLALFISAAITTYLAPEAEGQGTERVIHAIHTRSGKIDATVIPAKLVATIVTIVAGGSVGNVGPCAQIGSGLSSLFADAIKLDKPDRKKLVICGLSAGFASVFGTPLAGAILGAEILFIGRMMYGVLFPSVIAATVAYYVTSSFGITFLTPAIGTIPDFTGQLFVMVACAGIFFGFCAFLLVETMNVTKWLASQTKLNGPLNGVLGGMLLIGLVFLFSEQFLGTGREHIQSMLTGAHILWYAFLIKILFTSLTLHFGGSGGIVMPICFIGAAAGSMFANLFSLDSGIFAALGLIGLLAGAINAPLTSIVLAIELFGPSIAVYAAIVCAGSFLMSGHRSVLPTQLLVLNKSGSLHIEHEQAVEQVQTAVQVRNRSVLAHVLSLIRRLSKRVKSTPE